MGRSLLLTTTQALLLLPLSSQLVSHPLHQGRPSGATILRRAAARILAVPSSYSLLISSTIRRRPYSTYSSDIGYPSTSSSATSAISMTQVVIEDEFGDDGDDSFWEDFDVDAVVASSTSANNNNNNNNQNSKTDMTNTVTRTPPPPPSKRAKVSPPSNHNNNHHHDNDNDHGNKDHNGDNNDSSSSTPATTSALHDCLERYFGFRQFRSGQEEAIRAVLQGKDVAIFWATGSGKSLTFTLPPLLLQQTALVVSPLISLMQDQVHKLNGLMVDENNNSGNNNGSTSPSSSSSSMLATYLGSAQLDGSMEQRALQGEFRLIFCTPEKLQSPGFLDALASSRKLKLCLIAIDESHCVSDWGHDFRPDYRQAGRTLRSHPQLYKIPLMALTATAVPRIQTDILETLQMRKHEDHLFVSKKSFDRPNLAIKVVPKDNAGGGGALRSAMEPLVQTLLQEERASSSSNGRGRAASTIIYASTKAQVEEIASFLQQRLEASQSAVQVEYYHGALSPTHRHETHIHFLTGQTAVVVATIAFGMGIDKPDTRRVIHFGPPQTVEEYYQQIGRAGRDGLPAECTLYAAPADFDKYHSDFYLGSLRNGGNLKALKATMNSTNALKQFAMNKEQCRRRALLEFFDEVPTYDHCGTCDVCLARQQYGDDTRRDFGPIARLILEAVAGLKEQGMTTVLQVLGGKIVEGYRYKSVATSPTALKEKLETDRAALPKKVAQDHLKEFVTALIQGKYLSEQTKRADVGGYSRTWTIFQLTSLGASALKNTSVPIVLPVPDCIREAERQEEVRRQRVLQQLQDSGVSLDKLPQKEIEDGDGEVIQAYLTWNRRIESLQKNEDKHERLSQVQELLQLLEEWRSDAAKRLQMAPASVLAEHVLYSVAYTAQSFPAGMKMTPKDLEQSGARSREIQSLADVINSWLDRYQQQQPTSASALSPLDDPKLVLPSGPTQAPNGKWDFAVYRPNKKTGLASWESSYLRFQKGVSPATIAISPEKGRPLAVTTVLGHIQEAFLQGRPVDLQKLGSYAASSLPTKSQWDQLEDAESKMGINIAGDPTTSGVGGGNYTMTDLLRPIMGEEFSDKPYDQRTEQEKQRFSHWCEALKWYQLMRRGGILPTFESPGEKVTV